MKSHYIFAQEMLKELAKSGHNVTVFTVFKTKDLPQNYHEIVLELPSLNGNKNNYLTYSPKKYVPMDLDTHFFRV